MSDFRDFLNQQLEDEEFRKEWEALQPEYNTMRAIIEARKKNNLTQKQLAEKTGIDQADISKIETGNANPTIHMLQRLADGMDMILKLEFIPKNKVWLFKKTRSV